MANVEDVYHVLLHNLKELLELNLAVGTIVATEANQDIQIANQGTMITTLDNLLTCCQAIDANTDGLEAQLTSVINLLTSIDGKVATEATLLTIKADTASIISQLTTLNAVDFATETTLNSLLTAFNAEDFSTETTLAALLAAFNGEDFATEATLLAIKAKTDQLTFTTNKLRTTGEDAGGVGGGSISDKLLQVDTVGITTYLGYADAGTLTSAATWAVKKIVETGSDVSITWADGNTSFDNIWNDRLTLTYS